MALPGEPAGPGSRELGQCVCASTQGHRRRPEETKAEWSTVRVETSSGWRGGLAWTRRGERRAAADTRGVLLLAGSFP